MLHFKIPNFDVSLQKFFSLILEVGNDGFSGMVSVLEFLKRKMVYLQDSSDRSNLGLNQVNSEKMNFLNIHVRGHTINIFKLFTLCTPCLLGYIVVERRTTAKTGMVGFVEQLKMNSSTNSINKSSKNSRYMGVKT